MSSPSSRSARGNASDVAERIGMPRLALVTLLPCLFVGRAAFAQESHPAMDARGYLTIDGSQTIGHEELSFGLGSLDWGHGVPGANDLVSATLVGAFGLNLG